MIFNPTEKYQSQIPALQMLVGLGYRAISQRDALAMRGGRLSNVTLDRVLAEKLLEINRYSYKGREYAFDLADAYEAIRRLKPTPDRIRGLRRTNQEIYDTLVLGTTITKTIDGDSKSYSFRFIDWDRPENNVFHVTSEMQVERTAGAGVKRCDIVAYVNGIPFVVIENKRPTESVRKAASQLIGYQHEENIPRLFYFAQLLLTMNRLEARYATVGTSRKFWQTWRDEEDTDADCEALVNRRLTVAEKDAIFSGELAPARSHFELAANSGDRAVTEQDRMLFALCRPERLLDLIRRFTVFDGGVRKVARHQQYFGIKQAIEKVKQFDLEGRRHGGVVWHTQGSGKSLTMVMFGRALALQSDIVNPRIIIVTDRDDLDKQIKDTFKSCDMEPVRAISGAHLVQLIRNKTELVTTIINKFDTATRAGDLSDEDPDVFVLVDESHRTQTGRYGGHGNFAAKMRRIFPGACYLGFTGTPLLKKEKNTVSSFGGLIHKYTIDEAVRDGAVVPLLYEGRMVEQQITGDAIDRWFDKISAGLTGQQKADLKRKYSRMNALSKTEQSLRAKAFDISEHYRQHWHGTGFKAQVIAPSKVAAVRLKEVIDEIGHVTAEVVISPPGTNEGNQEVDRKSKDVVRSFWDWMMARYGSEEEYTGQIIDQFKGTGGPEILIVVSKLLTGFDVPRNTVLYVCRTLREHNLLQAIARVNRLYEENGTEKQFGFVIDYEGLLGELDKALTTYSAFEGYDASDLAGTVHDVREEIQRLTQLHNQLWDLFKSVAHRMDMEEFEQFLADDAIRCDFYERLRLFARCLHISLSSEKIFDVFTVAEVDSLKQDWTRFLELRKAVQLRYQEIVDVKEYEEKIQQLLDSHVVALPAEVVVEFVNINDPEALSAVIDEVGVSESSKADRIASATRRVIVEKMDEDPDFYRRFSEMLHEAIRDYRMRRTSEQDYLCKVTNLASRVARKDHDRPIPDSLKGNDDGQAFLGILAGVFVYVDGREVGDIVAAQIALDVIKIIRKCHIVGAWSNVTVQNNMRNAIDDFFYDVLGAELGIQISVELMDDLQLKIMDLARARFPG